VANCTAGPFGIQKKEPQAGERVYPHECSVPSYNPLESLEAQALPSRRHTRPRGAVRSLGADSCGLPSPRNRAPPAQGRPDGPDAVPMQPVGVAVPLLAGARSPALAPSATQSSAPGRSTDLPELPREGRYPSGTVPSLTWPRSQRHWPA